METLYSVKEVCGILKVKRVLVFRLIHEGRLLAFKLGGGRLWRIRERNLKRFVASSSACSARAIGCGDSE